MRSRSQLVVFPSTDSGYGTKSGEVLCTETTALEPISLYGRTKVAAEAELLASEDTISLRLATLFGLSPRPRLDLLVNYFCWTAVTDGYLVVFEKDFKRNLSAASICDSASVIVDDLTIQRPTNLYGCGKLYCEGSGRWYMNKFGIDFRLSVCRWQ
jgi:nucleoside-diphosphate-sugar epimerase